MIDVSQVTNYGMILLCVFGALLVIGFLKGFLGGFWKSVVKFVLWIALIVATIMFAPVVGEELASTGIVENFLDSLGNTSFKDFIIGTIGNDLYAILAGIAMLILGSIIIGLIGMIAKALFKKKGFFSRVFGAIFSTAFNAVIVTILFIVSTSPLLFHGGQEHVDNNQYLKMYQEYVVTPVQGILKENKLPSTVEDAVLVALGEEATDENITKLFNVIGLVVDGEEALHAVVEFDQDGNPTGLNQEKASALYGDLVFAAKLIDKMSEGSTKDSLNDKLQTTLNDNLSPLIYEGNAISTVTVNAADYDAMQVYMASLGFTSNLENTVNKIFVKA